jgi:hypothetical protein
MMRQAFHTSRLGVPARSPTIGGRGRTFYCIGLLSLLSRLRPSQPTQVDGHRPAVRARPTWVSSFER